MGKRVMAALLLALFLGGCAGEAQVQTTAAETGEIRERVMTLPLKLAEGGLVVEEISQYSGEYWENGVPETVENVAAVLVSNPGRRMIQYAAIQMECGGKRLHFFLYDLPPGEKCLVMEKEGGAWEGPVRGAEILGIRWCGYDLAPEQVRWVGMNETLVVGNSTGRTMENVCLRYKRNDQERGCFLGGISFSVHTAALEAGQEQVLTPLHYQAGRWKVIAIVTGA